LQHSPNHQSPNGHESPKLSRCQFKSISLTTQSLDSIKAMPAGKPGLYANINAKKKAGKKPRRKGAKGAPTDADFKAAARTAKKKKK
jgi:hypothetical protein